MRKIFILFLVIISFFYSCSNKKNASVLNTSNLRAQYFKIDPETDTTIYGLRGGIFKIEKGSFDGTAPLEIEIKEVYSPIEMLYARLTTESDGRLLESGGMIYFNAKRKGSQLKLLKPINISIPTNYINKEMQLFKGEEKPDGTINWIDPEPLDTSINKPAIDTGKLLFDAKCANCHNLFTDLTGPKLAWVEERVNDRKTLRDFIRHPAAVMAENSYFLCQKYKFGSTMTGFRDLSDRDIDLVLDYIKNEESGRPDLKPTLSSQSALIDSTHLSSCIPAPCGFDTLYVDTTQYETATANMIGLGLEATKNDSLDSQYKKPDSLEAAQRTLGFTDVVSTAGRYNFRIKTMGWFNVDAFYEGLKDTKSVDLFVKSDFSEKIDVHVFFPAKKLLTVGLYHEDDQLYHFQKYKGQIPLFLNDEAIAFGITSVGEKIYYGITPFKVQNNQTIQLKIQESTKEELTRAFKELQLDGIDLDIITKKRIIMPKICADTTKLIL